jgi:hypothetical protein
MTDLYLANPKLKRAYVPISFTQEQIEEYVRCANDVEYFTEKYIKIVNIDRGLIPFDMYDYQRNMLKTFMNERFVITKMPRQSGKCLFINTSIKLRNKKTGEVVEMTVGEFYEYQCKLRDMRSNDERVD